MQTGHSDSLTIPRLRISTSDGSLSRDFRFIALALLGLVGWEASGLDLPLEHLWGNVNGFFWRDHWLTSGLLHDGARALAWIILGAMILSLKWPKTFARDLSRRERLWLITTTLVCVAFIPLLKQASLTSCPWALAEFGGGVARYVPHWLPGQSDGGPGGCFPSGHASTAFAFLGGWFVLRGKSPGAGRAWLLVTVLSGFVLGWTQMVRGAHYLSHSLWTAWLCWVISAISYHALSNWRNNTRPCSGSEVY